MFSILWPNRKKRLSLFYFLLFFFISANLCADEGIDLGEIVIEDEKIENKSLPVDATSSSTVLIPDKKEKEVKTVPQLLEQSAGVNIKRYGRMDDLSSLSLRGSSANQVQIYIDDMPLMSATGFAADLSLIPLQAIEQIEIYRGGSPGEVPDGTIGGVIVLRTKKEPKRRDSFIYAGIGSFESSKIKLGHIQKRKNFSPIIIYEHNQSKGDFKYNDDRGTRFNATDDIEATRDNNNFISNKLFSKFIFNLPKDIDFSLTNIFFQKDEGVPGLGSRKSTSASLGTCRNLSSIILERKNIHFDLFFDYNNSQFKDLLSEIGIGIEDNDDKTYRFGSNFKFNYNLTPKQKLTFFIAGRSEFYVPYDSFANPQGGEKSSRQSYNAGITNDIYFLENKINLTPSIRIENLDDNHQMSVKLGIAIKPADPFTIKSNIYRGFRNPTFTELYGDRGALQGNPALLAEKAINFDIGALLNLPKKGFLDFGKIELTYFQHDVDRLIQFVQTSTFTAKAMNLNKALIQGVEVSNKFKLNNRFGLSASYTYQIVKDTSDNANTNGNYLPGRPVHELYCNANWSEKWLAWFSSRLYFEMRYMSNNYLDTQNILIVTNRKILGSGISFEFIDRISLSFSVNNILDDKISDLIGYPLPGRSFWSSLEVRM